MKDTSPSKARSWILCRLKPGALWPFRIETPQQRNIRLAKDYWWRKENCFDPPCHRPDGVGICPDCGEKELRHRAEGGATVILACRACKGAFHV